MRNIECGWNSFIMYKNIKLSCCILYISYFVNYTSIKLNFFKKSNYLTKNPIKQIYKISYLFKIIKLIDYIRYSIYLSLQQMFNDCLAYTRISGR